MLLNAPSMIVTTDPLESHLYYLTPDTLSLYVHMPAPDRMLLHIKRFLSNSFCEPDEMMQKSYGQDNLFTSIADSMKRNATHCVLDEDLVIHALFTNRDSFDPGPRIPLPGQPLDMTCESYKAIKKAQPDILFVHYRQLVKLRKVLAKNFCPDGVSLSKQDDRKRDIFLKQIIPTGTNSPLEESQELAQIDEWLEERRGISCAGKN